MIGTSRAALLGAAGAGGGGAPYHADAVHLDGSTGLSIASLAATDNGKFSMAYWAKVPEVASTSGSLWDTDPAGTLLNELTVNIHGDGTWSLAGDLFSSDFSSHYGFNNNTTAGATATWQCIIASFDMNHANGARPFVMYIGNTLQTITLVADTGAAWIPQYNGIPFAVFGEINSFFTSGDYADVRLMPGIDLIVAGDIPEATRRLFIDADGKPVNPSVATASLGTPCMLFSGNAASFGTNQGSGGAFTTTGTLANASTSPSD